MSGHYKQVQFDKKMKKLFDEVDDILENEYGDLFPLHPNRAKRGKTANKEADGLFNIGTTFTAGYGSKYGRGYVIDIKISTLSKITKDTKEEIETEAINLIKAKLPVFFPSRELEVVKDYLAYKIIGDFNLGNSY